MSDRIKMEYLVKRIRFCKDNWGILVGEVVQVFEGNLKTDKYDTTIKGPMPSVKEGETYKVVAEYVEDPKWGGQYNIEIMTACVTLDDSDARGKRKFLESIFSKGQVESMYAALEDPYNAFLNKDTAQLVKVRGCGLKTCPEWIERFERNYHRLKIYIELEDFNLSAAIIDKLLDRYTSPEIVIEKVTSNPYTLVTDVKGIGWGIADKIAVAGGMSEYDPRRISAFILYYLEEQGENGNSWITNDHLMGAIIERFGEDIPDAPITQAMHELIDEERVWTSDDKQRIGHKRYYNLEKRIAEELLRLRNAESVISHEGWEEAIRRIEKLQGWDYSDEQRMGIEAALTNNVVLIQGPAGSGKTSLVWAVIEVLKRYHFVQCALSGKAASRMTEVTGEEGFTIHRLLGYPKGPDEKGKYLFNDENQMSYDIYIVDEVSMIDLRLFNRLLQAIPSGAKVIFLGDNGQLEAIGSGNIAYDLLNSDEIKSVTLTKIHRQAEKSAIITESVKIRKKQQIIPKDWTGHEVRGELKDLEVICYSDISNTYYKVMEQFQRCWAADRNIENTQIIVPSRIKGNASTYMINNAVQEICNPKKNQKEVKLYASKGMPFFIRTGDKVINRVNNYNTQPNIFNGNVGIVKAFIPLETNSEEEVMIVDFYGIGEVVLKRKYWENLELAYALTTHLSQGNQYDTVIFAIDFNSYSLLSKELLYTGITRAKNKCYLIAQNSALRFATAKSSVVEKQTHLREQLHNIAHPKIVF